MYEKDPNYQTKSTLGNAAATVLSIRLILGPARILVGDSLGRPDFFHFVFPTAHRRKTSIVLSEFQIT